MKPSVNSILSSPQLIPGDMNATSGDFMPPVMSKLSIEYAVDVEHPLSTYIAGQAAAVKPDNPTQ